MTYTYDLSSTNNIWLHVEYNNVTVVCFNFSPTGPHVIFVTHLTLHVLYILPNIVSIFYLINQLIWMKRKKSHVFTPLVIISSALHYFSWICISPDIIFLLPEGLFFFFNISCSAHLQVMNSFILVS